MKLPMMPKNLRRVEDDEKFAFACHRGVRCFTHCCRHLELALTPYDVLRLKRGLELSSTEFLERYVIVEREEADIFPRLYLTMVDDGKVSCVFVSRQGCRVYPDRPGACRAYPMGRASMRSKDNTLQEFYVLLNEEHCQGFEEPSEQTPVEYGIDQGLDVYNAMNDLMVPLLQHEKIRRGRQLSEEEADLYVACLYDLDGFREKLRANRLNPAPDTDLLDGPLQDDEELLRFAVRWLIEKLFSDSCGDASCSS